MSTNYLIDSRHSRVKKKMRSLNRNAGSGYPPYTHNRTCRYLAVAPPHDNWRKNTREMRMQDTRTGKPTMRKLARAGPGDATAITSATRISVRGKCTQPADSEKPEEVGHSAARPLSPPNRECGSHAHGAPLGGSPHRGLTSPGKWQERKSLGRLSEQRSTYPNYRGTQHAIPA